MANIITAPESGIYFDGNTAGVADIPTLTGNASGVAIQYDGYAGIEINSSATGVDYLDRFSVEGANGRLFGVSDAVTGTVFSVNDAAGLPIIEVESTSDYDKITIGEYGTDALVVSGDSVGVGTASPRSGLDIGDSDLYIGNHPTTKKIYFGNSSNYFTRGGIHTTQTNLGLYNNYSTGYITLNTDSGEAVRIDENGKVGIGTTNPNVKLHVEGDPNTAGVLGRFYGSATHGALLQFHRGASYNWLAGIGGGSASAGVPSSYFGIVENSNTPRLVIAHSTGNVGIGTVSPDSLLEIANTPAAQSQTRMLHIDNNPVSNQGSGYIQISSGTNSQATTQIEQVSSGGFGLLGNKYLDTNIINKGLSASAHGNINFATGSSTSATSIVMTIGGGSQKGNVGIGTTSPDHTLRVNGDTRLGNLHIKTSDFGASGTGKTIYADGAGAGVLGFISSTAFDFSNGTTSRLHIDSSGNVGIGTTSPSQKLTVEGNIELGTGGYIYGDTTSPNLLLSNAAGARLQYGTSSLQNGGSLQFVTASGTLFRVNNTGGGYFNGGNIGIGTTSPSYRLSVDDNSVTNIPKTLLQFDASSIADNGGYNIDFRTSSNDLANRYVARIRGIRESSGALSQLSFWTESGSALEQRMTIRASGDIGIGTTTPNNKLQVNYAPVAIASLTAASGTASTNWNRNAGLMITGASVSNALAFGASGTANDRKAWIQVGHPDTAANSLGDLALNPLGGNVGIGTTSPTSKLEIQRSITGVPANDNTNLKLTDTTTSYAADAGGSIAFSAIYNSSGSVLGQSPYIKASKANGNNGDYGFGLRFGVRASGSAGSNVAMTIADSSNVGIGNTDPTAAKLVVRQDSGYAFRTENASGWTFRVAGDTGNTEVGGNLTVSGDLTVNGTTSTINSTTVQVDDKNIELGTVASPTDTTADGGGITLKGATDKTINWVNSTDAWTFSERISIPAGSAAAPSLTFSNDTDTGIFRELSGSSELISFSTEGIKRVHISSAGIFSQGNVYSATGGQFRNFAGVWKATTGTTGNGFQFISADATALTISSTGDVVASGSVTATSLVRSGGTSSQFLKADGSVDSNSYLTTSAKAADSDKLDGLDSLRFPYALNGSLGSTNTFVTDGGVGADNITRSMFYRDNGNQFGTIGFNAQHATSTGYSWQMASTSYSDASAIQARVKNNGTWSSPVTIWNSGNDGSGSGLDADLLDGNHASAFATASQGTSAETAYGWGNHASAGYLTAHPTISAASSSDNSGRTYIQDILLDSNGHVTGITTATETVTDTNTTYSAGTHLSLSGTTFNVDFATANKVVNIGHNSTNNEAELILDTSNAGSPQISFTDHGDASWAIGVDDEDNSFKIHGVATSTIPTIGNLATPLFEITTGGIGYLGTNRLFADNYHPNADKLTVARTISLGGDLSGSASFDGSANITITAAVANDSHTHNANNLTGTTLASGVTASSLTSVGTIGTGTWQGSVIASAYLDADTAHLSGTQTFSGQKTFNNDVTFNDNVVFDGAGKTVTFDSQRTVNLPAIGTKMRILTLSNLTFVKVFIISSENAYVEPIELDIFYNNQGSAKPVIHRLNNYTWHVHSNDIAFSADTSGNIYMEKLSYTTGRSVRVHVVKKYQGTVTLLDGTTTTTTDTGSDESNIGKLGTITSGTWQGTVIDSDYIGGRLTKKISGDGTTTNFTVTHSFGTPRVMTQILDYGDNGTGATYEVINTTVKRSSDNAISVVFGTAPTSSEDYLVLMTEMPAIS